MGVAESELETAEDEAEVGVAESLAADEDGSELGVTTLDEVPGVVGVPEGARSRATSKIRWEEFSGRNDVKKRKKLTEARVE